MENNSLNRLSHLIDPLQAANYVIQKLSTIVSENIDRSLLFTSLSREIKKYFYYDRLQINLYDSEREFLNSFTKADGTIVEILSSTRIAHNAVAWQAIQTHKPVIINDLASHEWGNGASSLASAGLNSTIVVPLILNQNVLGTLHISFIKQPDNLSEILYFLKAISPVLTTFLFVVLTEERNTKDKAVQLAQNNQQVSIENFENILIDTIDMSNVMSTARNVAKLNVPILILGETGTGKSVLAKWIHYNSPRRKNNFVKVNCPSLAPTLFESELFGYARGAFTGAYTKRVGRIELAQNGSLFLDEIGDISPDMQSKLLQIIEENCFERIGESQSIAVDIRILSATNINISEAMENGLFRNDLFYRLSTVILKLPPLRERKNDIPKFIKYFIEQFSKKWDIHPPKLSTAVLKELCSYNWPGNIRELRNVISRILLYSLDRTITISTINDALNDIKKFSSKQSQKIIEKNLTANNFGLDLINNIQFLNENKFLKLEELEKKYIKFVLKKTNGRVSGQNGAANILGIPRSTLQNKIKKWELK